MIVMYLKAILIAFLTSLVAALITAAIYAGIAVIIVYRNIAKCLRWINQRLQTGPKS